MRNQAIQRKIQHGEAVDVSGFVRTVDGDYILPDYADDIDYCNAKTEEWIWSIGRHRESGQILASTTQKFYLNPAFECLWLR